jgi:hypothetical protein
MASSGTLQQFVDAASASAVEKLAATIGTDGSGRVRTNRNLRYVPPEISLHRSLKRVLLWHWQRHVGPV